MIETREIERGIAEKPNFFVITCFMYENRISLDGRQIGQ